MHHLYVLQIEQCNSSIVFMEGRRQTVNFKEMFEVQERYLLTTGGTREKADMLDGRTSGIFSLS